MGQRHNKKQLSVFVFFFHNSVCKVCRHPLLSRTTSKPQSAVQAFSQHATFPGAQGGQNLNTWSTLQTQFGEV